MQWAIETSKTKTLNTIDSWKRRNTYERFINIFTGDLAKNIFKEFILENIPTIKNKIIEYDQIRTDGFKDKDKFDLQIRNCVMEVKSSGEKYTRSLHTIYNKRRIIINIGNIHEHDTCVVAQVFYIPNNLKFFTEQEKISNCNNFDSFVNQFINNFTEQNVIAIISGWVDYKMQIEAKEKVFEIGNKAIDTERRKYANLLISESKSPDELLDFLKKEGI